MTYDELTLETALAQADGDAARINAVWPPPQGPSDIRANRLDALLEALDATASPEERRRRVAVIKEVAGTIRHRHANASDEAEPE